MSYRDRDATSHLFHVSGGLESLVMGEGQILAQVKQVYKVRVPLQRKGQKRVRCCRLDKTAMDLAAI